MDTRVDLQMSVIFEINRDFPHQVALSFDEIAMEVLEWLDGSTCEWGMYVDLPASTRPLLFSYIGGCDGVQATVLACVGKANW